MFSNLFAIAAVLVHSNGFIFPLGGAIERKIFLSNPKQLSECINFTAFDYRQNVLELLAADYASAQFVFRLTDNRRAMIAML